LRHFRDRSCSYNLRRSRDSLTLDNPNPEAVVCVKIKAGAGASVMTTAYDVLRMKGVELGKRDFIGRLRKKG